MTARRCVVVVWLIACVFGASGQNINVLCIAEHCMSQATGCVLDSDCREAIGCIGPCGANQTCAFICLNSYADTAFDAFMKCAVTDHKCIGLTPPDHPVRCRKPSPVVSNFTLNDLQGKWYSVRGLNPIYDCFDCQISTYSLDVSPNKALVREQYDALTVSGKVKHLETNETVLQPSAANGGLLYYNSTQDGLVRRDQFRILDFSRAHRYVLMYYCGGTGSWAYEGAIVYSREPNLSPAALSQVTSSAATFGYNLTEFCSPKTSGCMEP